MKADWKKNTLENCLERFRVPAKIQRKQFREAGAFPIVSQEADFINGYWDEAEDVCVLDHPVVIFGDHTQVLKYVDFDFVVGADGVKVLAPKPFIDAKYLYYFVMANRAPSLGYARHYRHVKELTVSYPALEEQLQIVAVLDEAFEGLARAREHAEVNLQNARELFVGTIASEFSKIEPSGKRRVGDIAVHSLGKMLDKNKNKGTLRPYLRNLNVRWFTVDTSDLLEMRITDAEVKRYTVRKGDLLICEGGYPGRSSIWEVDDEIFFQKALHRVRFEDEAYSRLLMYFLYMSDQSGTLREHVSGAGIQHFTGQSLAKFEMPFPSVSVASEIISTIETMQRNSNELEGHFQQKLHDLDDLRQSLLQKAFAGELT